MLSVELFGLYVHAVLCSLLFVKRYLLETSAKVFVKDNCKGNKHYIRLTKFVFVCETEATKVIISDIEKVHN